MTVLSGIETFCCSYIILRSKKFTQGPARPHLVGKIERAMITVGLDVVARKPTQHKKLVQVRESAKGKIGLVDQL